MGKLVPKPNPDDLNGICHAIAQLDRKLNTGAAPTFASLTLADLTASRLVATDASKVLASADLASWITGTANQVIVTDDSDGTVTLSTPQDIHAAATPTFAGGTFTGTVVGIYPTCGDCLATKEYVDLSGLSGKNYWLSNTASGIGDNYTLYPAETGEAESTLVSAALGEGDDQLMFAWITEASEPGILQIRAGTYSVHTHLSRGIGDKSAVFYWTLTKVDADGTSNETLLMTSEESDAIETSMTEHSAHAHITAGVNIDVTSRLILKFYANVGASGGDAEVTIYMEGHHDCHLDIQVPSSIWQNQGDVLDDLNVLGVNSADGEFLVGTGAGAFAWESGATVRTSLGLGSMAVETAADYVLHSLADAANDFLVASGDDTLVKKTLAETGAILEGDIDHGNLQGLDTGADHSYIDQDVTNGANVTFGNLIVTDIDAHTISGKLTAGATEIEGSNFDINGGAIDATVIGGTTPAAIDGTTIDATGAISSVTGPGVAAEINIDASGTTGNPRQARLDIKAEAVVGTAVVNFIKGTPQASFTYRAATNVFVLEGSPGNPVMTFDTPLATGVTFSPEATFGEAVLFNDTADFDALATFDEVTINSTFTVTGITAHSNILKMTDDNYSSWGTGSDARMSYISATPALQLIDIVGSSMDFLIRDFSTVQVGDSSNYTNTSNGGDMSFVGGAGFYPRRITQAAEPANGTGATQIDVGEVLIWRDSDDDTISITYNDTDAGITSISAGGSDDHSALSNLDYASAGHTGHLAIGSTAAVSTRDLIQCAETFTITDDTGKSGINLGPRFEKTTAAFTGVGYGLVVNVRITEANTQNWTHVAGLRGLNFTVRTLAGSTGTLTAAVGIFANSNFADAMTVTNFYAALLGTPTVANNKLTNAYGLYVENQNTAATLNYAIYTNLGLVRFGDTVSVEGPVFLKEQATADGDTAAYGQIWVKNTTPAELWFTDDGGTDHQIAYV